MIEITAKLCRGSVYFTGEQIECQITFKNVARDDELPTERESTETLAWAGVQIYCHCIFDESKAQYISDTSSRNYLTSTDTSFYPSKSERGHTVFATTPRILVCDLKLGLNESKTFTYKDHIPLESPPSYYGSAAKYVYKLTIGTQRVNSVIQLLRIPLRLLSAESLDFLAKQVTEQITSSDDDCHVNGCEDSHLDLVLHKLECLTAKRSPGSFAITNQLGHVARFFLLKSTFKLGEDVIGVFDFSEAIVPCVQFTVSLQSEEILSDECKVNQSRPSSTLTTYTKCHEFCLHTTNTQIILPIPLTITPAFSTNMISLSWRLHFEFVNTKQDDVTGLKLSDSQGVMERSPSEIKVQTMVWDLPLTIFPTHPIQVARGLQLPASSSIIV
ncbi:RAB6A-GEF complex partner protein 2 [Halotydeus destructor]|nr:RAB6A-GEF complex partner protein 2 [Halotydeus destructor]